MESALLRQEPNEAFERTRSRFVSAIHSLGEPAELLLDIYGLSDRAEGLTTLTKRRGVHAKSIGRSVETVADREVPAIKLLITALVTGTYAQSPLIVSVPEMHDGIIYETTSTLIIVENRNWKQTIEHYRFVATFDEMDFLTITRSYPARAAVDSAGAFRLNSRPTGHGFNDHFWHLDKSRTDNEPMRRGETYDLRFTLAPLEGEEPPPLVNAYRAFHERSLLASIRVAFMGEKPEVVWSYERVSHFAQPGHLTAKNKVAIDEEGVASLRLRDVHGGLVSGLAWRWQPADSLHKLTQRLRVETGPRESCVLNQSSLLV